MSSADDLSLDQAAELGYRRSPQAQREFDEAAATLLEVDGWRNPTNGGKPELRADLALEGGGVKGIALAGAILVLNEAGYSFRGVAGTSAGAIVASLVTALSRAGRPMETLRRYLATLDFNSFMPEGKLHGFLEHHGGKLGGVVADAAILSHKVGLYPGDYLHEWLAPILGDLGVVTFDDLRLTPADDPEIDVVLPAGRRFRLVVHTSDISRGQLVHLPWDYPLYGFDNPGNQEVVGAIRASMSIPFFFEPVTFETREAHVLIPSPDGRSVTQHYDAGAVTWVDGGLLRDFPITAFDRVDGKPPRWPTIGIKLSRLQTEFPATQACESAVSVGLHCLHTMMNEWDTYAVDEATAGRTIFVDNGGLTATDFALTTAQQDMLFLNGVRAASRFIVDMAKARGIPRSADAALELARQERGGERC